MSNTIKTTTEPEYYSVKTLAKKLDVKEKLLREHTMRIPGRTKVGHLVRYNKEAVDKALNQGGLF